MPSCIICHLDIENEEDSFDCPNGHQAHQFCLSEWIIHSENCPVCNTKYDSYILAKCKDYINQKSKENEAELQDKLQEQKKNKIEKIAQNIVFLKLMEFIEDLIEKEEFDDALDRLNSFNLEEFSNQQHQTILFLKGKIYYFKERYDMSIGHLFKLVKDKFDYPEAFLYLGKSYQKLGLMDKAKWAFDRAK